MTPSSSAQSVNRDLVVRVGTLIHTGSANSDDEVFADDFVFHYVNPKLAELQGEHHAYDGFRSFFERLHQDSDTGFTTNPVRSLHTATSTSWRTRPTR